MPEIEAEGWIAGPGDGPSYAEEYRNLTEPRPLRQRVKFLGFQRIGRIPAQGGRADPVVVSEALPLVVLEGYAAGVPSISTDVARARRQLICGFRARRQGPRCPPAAWWASPTAALADCRRPALGSLTPGATRRHRPGRSAAAPA